MARDRKLRHLAVGGDAADAIAGGFAEPQRAVAHCDRQRLCSGSDAIGKFGDPPVGRDAGDAADFSLGEPDIAVGAEHHAVRPGVRRRQRELRDLAAHGDAADLVGALLRKPHRAVAADRDADRRRIRRRQGEFSKRAAVRIETADLRCAALAEPQRAVRALHGNVRLAAGARNLVLANGDSQTLLRLLPRRRVRKRRIAKDLPSFPRLIRVCCGYGRKKSAAVSMRRQGRRYGC